MRIGKKESEILRLYNERKGKKMKYLERINAIKYQRTTTKYWKRDWDKRTRKYTN